ncbi:hypothetical protein IJ384_00890 [bacterium]|nr:hypothetical protein [bacterium]
MSTNINANILKNFIIKSVGSELTAKEAQKLGIENEYKEAADELDVNMIDIDDILENNDLYEQFATLYVNDKEEKAKAKDEEQEKEEQMAIKDKNGAGV